MILLISEPESNIWNSNQVLRYLASLLPPMLKGIFRKRLIGKTIESGAWKAFLYFVGTAIFTACLYAYYRQYSL